MSRRVDPARWEREFRRASEVEAWLWEGLLAFVLVQMILGPNQLGFFWSKYWISIILGGVIYLGIIIGVNIKHRLVFRRAHMAEG